MLLRDFGLFTCLDACNMMWMINVKFLTALFVGQAVICDLNPESPPRRLATDWILIEKDLVDGPLVDVQVHYPVEPSSYYPVLIAITPTYPNDLAHGPITHQEMGGNPIYQTNQNQPSASKEGNEQQDVAGNEKIGISALNLDWNSSESSLISPFSSVSSPILSALHNSFNSVLDKTLSLNSLEYGVIASHGFVVIEIPDDLMDPWPIDLLEDTISWVYVSLEDYIDYSIYWEREAIMCQLQTCHHLLQLTDQHTEETPQAVIFHEPSSSVLSHLPEERPDLPALFISTEAASEPTNTLYENWACPKYMLRIKGDGTANEQTTDELTTSVPFRDDTKESSPEIEQNNEEFSENKKIYIKGKDTQPSQLIEHYTSLQYKTERQKSALEISLINTIVAMLRVYLDDLDDYKQNLKCDYLDKFGACSTDMTCDD